MADVSLLFDVDGGGSIDTGSGALIKKSLLEIVANIEKSNTTKITFTADTSSVKKALDDLSKLDGGSEERKRKQKDEEKQTNSLAKAHREYLDIQKKIAAYGGAFNRNKLSSASASELQYIAQLSKTAQASMSKIGEIHPGQNIPKDKRAKIESLTKVTNELARASQLASLNIKNLTVPTAVGNSFDKLANKLYSFQRQTLTSLSRSPKMLGETNSMIERLRNRDFSSITAASAAVQDLQYRIRAAGLDTETFSQKLQYMFSTKIGYGAVTLALSLLRSSLQKLYTNVVEIDSGLTQLKIVTGATDSQLAVFATHTAANAEKIGASIKDLIKSTEVYARLGYSLNQSELLADITAMYANVASTDTSSATSSMTAILKGFTIDPKDAEHVADMLTLVGQKYAISASELGIALENGGAALESANNTIEESVALAAAGNAAVQDAGKVGNALKTSSMRIRGSTASELEDLGLETASLCESTSKLREEIQLLSGVDIMKSATEFKSTYDIMLEISKVWDDMSDVNQATLLEDLAGKRNATVIKSIITNVKDLEGAYSAATNSAGTLADANAVYVESIGGKLAQTSALFQQFSSDALNSDTVKVGVDLVNTIVKIADALARVNLLLPVATASFLAFKAVGERNNISDMVGKIVTSFSGTGNKSMAARDAAISMQGLSAAKRDLTLSTLASAGADKAAITEMLRLIDSGELVTAMTFQRSAASAKLDASQVRELTTLVSLSDVNGQAVAIKRKDFAASLQAAVNTNLLTTAKKDEILAKLGSAAASKEEAKANIGLAASFKLVMASNPLLWIPLVLSVLPALAKMFDALTTSAAEHAEKLEALKSSYNELVNETKAWSDEIATTSDRIRELSLLASSGKISIAEEDELRRLKTINTELQAKIVLNETLMSQSQAKIDKEFISTMESGSNDYKVLDPLNQYDGKEAFLASRLSVIDGLQEKILNKEQKFSAATIASFQRTLTENEEWLRKEVENFNKSAEGVSYRTGTNLTESDQAVNRWLDQGHLLADQYTLSFGEATAATTVFSNVWNRTQFADASAEIKQLGDAGNLTASSLAVLSGANPEVKALLANLSILGLFSFDNVDALAQQIQTTGDAATDVAGNLDDLQESLTSASEKYTLLTNTQEEYKRSGGFTSSTLSSICEKFSSMKGPVGEYIAGMITSKELLESLTAAYAKDEDAFNSNIVAKLEKLPDFYAGLTDAQKQIVDALAGEYKDDLANFKTIEGKKLEYQALVIRSIAGNWGAYNAKSLEQLKANYAAMGANRSAWSAERVNEFNQLGDAIKKIELYNKGADTIVAGTITSKVKDFAPSKSTGKNTAASSAKEASSAAEKSMDEIYAGIVKLEDNVSRATARMQRMGGDTTSKQVHMWMVVRQNVIAEMNKIKDHTSSAYKYLEDKLIRINDSISNAYQQKLDAIDLIIEKTKELIRDGYEKEKAALEKQKSDFREIIDLRKKMLQQASKEADYESEVAKRTREISKIQSKISQLSLDDSREAAAKKSELEAQLAEKQDELAKYQASHQLELTQDTLDAAADAFDESKDDEIDAIDKILSDEDALYAEAIARINSSWDSLYDDLKAYASAHGLDIKEITDAWEKAKKAAEEYGGILEAQGGLQAGQDDLESNGSLGDYDDVAPGGGNGGTGGNKPSSSIYDKTRSKFGSPPSGSPNLQIGSSGSGVKWLQYFLDQVVNGGSGALPADGTFYTRTSSALKNFQKMAGIKADGIFGSATARALPKFHSGGIVGDDNNTGTASALSDSEVLAVLQRGEWVLDSAKQNGLRNILDFSAQIYDKIGQAIQSFGAVTPAMNTMSGGDTYAPQIAVSIQHNGSMTEADAAHYGQVVGEKALDVLKTSFNKRGV